MTPSNYLITRHPLDSDHLLANSVDEKWESAPAPQSSRCLYSVSSGALPGLLWWNLLQFQYASMRVKKMTRKKGGGSSLVKLGMHKSRPINRQAASGAQKHSPPRIDPPPPAVPTPEQLAFREKERRIQVRSQHDIAPPPGVRCPQCGKMMKNKYINVFDHLTNHLPQDIADQTARQLVRQVRN